MNPPKFTRVSLRVFSMTLMLCSLFSNLSFGKAPITNAFAARSDSHAAEASVSKAQDAEHQSQKQASQSDPDQARLQITRLLTILDNVAPQASKLHNQVAKARQQFDALTDEQWKVVADNLDLATFSKSVNALDSLAITPTTRPGAKAKGKLFTAQQKLSSQGGAPVINSALPPPEYDECGDMRSNTIAGIALRATAQSLEGVAIGADIACETIAVVFGEGTNAPACVAAGAAHFAVLAVRIFIEDFDFCDAVIDGIEINATLTNTEIIHEDLEFSVANDNANKDTIIANDNANRAAIIANDNANTAAIIANDNANKNELRDLILRTQIEADLAQAEGANPVAAFLTPSANGGYLELARALVVQAIANIKAAGGSVGQADSFLAQGDAAKAAGNFKTAYANYRKAYKAAVN